MTIGIEREYLEAQKPDAYLVGEFKRWSSKVDISHGGVLIHSCIARLGSDGSEEVVRPEEKLSLAFEASKTNIGVVAKQKNMSFNLVSRALRDTVASIIYLSGETDMSGLRDDVQRGISLLRKKETRLKEASNVRNQPSVDNLLNTIPHVRSLLDTYLQFGTVRYEIEKAEVAHSPYQLRSVGRFLLEPTIEGSLDGLNTLACRYIIGKWITGEWIYERVNGNSAISRAAKVIFAEQNSRNIHNRQKDTVRDIRLFLTEMMFQEFDSVVGNYFDPNWKYAKLFPNKDGGFARTKEELNIPLAYERFSKNGGCPMSIRKYATMIRDNVPKSERLGTIRVREHYSDQWRSTLDWAGVKFLENALSGDMVKKPCIERLIQNTGEVLKKVKQLSLV